MNEIFIITFWTLLAGIAMPIGAVMASIERIRTPWMQKEIIHFVTAFGAGALLSAVALVLVPDGIKHLSILSVSVSFIAGGIAFMLLDIWLVSIKRPIAQGAAMLADFLPEVIALGALFTTDASVAPLLAAIIALQNIPEGFNAYRELKETSTYSTQSIILIFLLLAFLGPIFGLLGYFWLGLHHDFLSVIMLFSAGGILYLIFQNIAPQIKLARHWIPPLGAVLGFLLGVIAKMGIGG